MTKFFFKFKKAYFIFAGQKKFFQKISQSQITSQGFLAPCRNSEISNDPIPRKQLKKQDGRMDRPYFIGPFQAFLGVQQVQL